MATVRLNRIEAEGELPAVCMRCGAPAADADTKKFSWHPQWVFVLIFAGLLPMLIVALILTKRMTVKALFCEAHRGHWTKRSRMIGGGLFVLFALAIAAVFVGAAQAVPEDVAGMLCVGCVFLGLAWVVFAVALQVTSIETREITDTHITLNRVGDGFVQALARQRQERRLKGDVDIVLPVSSGPGVGVFLLPGCFVLSLLIVVCLAAIQILGRNANSAFGTVGPLSPPAVVDQADHFRLGAFGANWILLQRNEVRQFSKLAAAGARTLDGELVAMVIVEDAPDDFRIEGKEQDFAEQFIAQNASKNKQTEFIAAQDFQGQKAVRYRFTGTPGAEGAYRYDTIVFVAQGNIYQLMGLGPVKKTAADGSTFQPFFNAFQLLPEDEAPKR